VFRLLDPELWRGCGIHECFPWNPVSSVYSCRRQGPRMVFQEAGGQQNRFRLAKKSRSFLFLERTPPCLTPSTSFGNALDGWRTRRGSGQNQRAGTRWAPPKAPYPSSQPERGPKRALNPRAKLCAFHDEHRIVPEVAPWETETAMTTGYSERG
jgi:hypothetical protein